jgi:hypothetical protein
MSRRAAIIWFLILAFAFVNGGVRVAWLIPRLGDTAGHVFSTLSLCLAILAVSWLSMGWIGVATRGDAIRVGLLWLVLTLAFEFLAGHYVFGTPWRQLLAEYNVLAGRIWILVLLTTAFAPLLTARTRNRCQRRTA